MSALPLGARRFQHGEAVLVCERFERRHARQRGRQPQAQRLDPDSTVIANNLELLQRAARAA